MRSGLINPVQLGIPYELIEHFSVGVGGRLNRCCSHGGGILANLKREVDKSDDNGDAADEIAKISEVFEQVAPRRLTIIR